MPKTIRDYSTQEAVNPGVGYVQFGGSLLGVVPRAVHANVDRTFKVTAEDGTRTLLAMLAGLDYNHRIVGVSAASGTAISSASSLVVGIL